jgi:hypothetical protein
MKENNMDGIPHILLGQNFMYWDWYSHLPTRATFIHLLLLCCDEHSIYTEKKRWTVVIHCQEKTAREIGIKTSMLRTCLAKLTRGGYISIEVIKWGDGKAKLVRVNPNPEYFTVAEV